MLNRIWLKGILRQRLGRLCGAITGVALTISVLAVLGIFIISSTATMTKRAIAGVPVDWQVQLAPGSSFAATKPIIVKTIKYRALEPVSYADTMGFSAQTGGTVQTTGPGKVLGISSRYRELFPREMRQLTGVKTGILVAQQTAANLHVKEGDTVTIMRVGLAPVAVKVAGVVDLPEEDSLFQAVGVPAGTAPQAPPDNVIIMPETLWRQLFDIQMAVRPDSAHQQWHLRLNERLPADPVAAYTKVEQLANHLEARLTGSGIVGNNLATRLDGVREDALYSKVLFLFLGIPGAILAMLLTLAVTASGKQHRRQEQALLQVRGASLKQILSLEAMEAFTVGIGGVIFGLGLTCLIGLINFPFAVLISPAALIWAGGSAFGGFILALAAVLFPARQVSRNLTVMAARASVSRSEKPLWQRIYLDYILLGIAVIVIWQLAGTGYRIILASEGVPSVSVHYEAFIGPLALWIGGILLTFRLWENGLAQGRRILTQLLNPICQKLSGVIAASLRRQRGLVARGMVLVALAVSFAVSTAIFNTTYNAQSRVDAELTNGADVTVSGTTTAAPSIKLAQLAALPGVKAAQPMQHRFAYVGNDLQDIYGINPMQIGTVTRMADAYFASGNAKATLTALAKHPDGVLVAEETVRDFQLQPGDQINLRLQNARDHQYHTVPFHYIGTVREFPTAPKDSFLVANANYIARQTGTGVQEVVLLRTNGDPVKVAARARKVVQDMAGVKVTDLQSAERTISSSLTAVDLHGLTRLELALALILVTGATGLILALGLTERKRAFTILAALGAKKKQLGAFLWSEGLFILLGGGSTGILLGFGIAWTLVRVLSGVFDPSPEFLSIPWGYLATMTVVAVWSTSLAIMGIQRSLPHSVVEELRKNSYFFRFLKN
jgi:putative ABC transport system permease protein